MKPPNDLSHKGRSVEEWVDLHFFRPIGIRIARALLPTGISADQVTLWSLVIGLVAGHLFAYRDHWTNLIGFGLFVVSDVFDSADGQLARLRGTSTRFGRVPSRPPASRTRSRARPSTSCATRISTSAWAAAGSSTSPRTWTPRRTARGCSGSAPVCTATTCCDRSSCSPAP
ncbi:MAG: hypothetical protein DMD73_04215 [Gemmatimonadetes bacterium]|nr:MAG: hypothetical protein DMD73_04215 [Gemmatimonadota bacterium]